MKHEMKIMVSKRGEKPISIAEFKKLSWPERQLSRWFGKTQRVLVIVPESSVQQIEIKEVESKNANQNAD
jgi:hypothetical protein